MCLAPSSYVVQGVIAWFHLQYCMTVAPHVTLSAGTADTAIEFCNLFLIFTIFYALEFY